MRGECLRVTRTDVWRLWFHLTIGSSVYIETLHILEIYQKNGAKPTYRKRLHTVLEIQEIRDDKVF